MAIRNGSNRNHASFKQPQDYGHSIPFLLVKSQCALLIHSMFAGDSGADAAILWAQFISFSLRTCN
jgi:hypothetical protein